VGVCDEAWGVIPGRTASSADLGGSSKYSNYHPEIGLSGARVPWPAEPRTFAGSGAPLTALENPWEGIAFTPGRTHNRSRSPR